MSNQFSDGTTPSEFDVVARKMGYVESSCERGWFDCRFRDGQYQRECGGDWESVAIIQGAKRWRKKANQDYSITIDGVAYRGSEETIGKMRELAEYKLRGEFRAWDRVRELEARSVIPEKWRKAIPKCYESSAAADNPYIEKVAQRIGCMLTDLADELEKGGG